MNVFVIVGNLQQFGVFTTERRAKVRLEELQRDGVSAVCSEVYLNETTEDDHAIYSSD